MAVTTTDYPVEYLEAIDEVLAGATFANAYNVGAAEFVNAKQISVPSINFGDSPEPVNYDRFKTEGTATIERTVYTLDHDVQQVFYIDAADSIDEAAANATTVQSEYIRAVLGGYIDKDFFKAANAAAKTKATTALTAANIKGEIRKARSQFTQAGLAGGNLYMSSTALALLEDATDRQWSNETAVTDTVGTYDGFAVYEVPDDRLQADFTVISGGTQTIRYITKRAAAYMFAPGQHQSGDGWLTQLRWIFGTIAYKNKQPGIYTSKASA